MTSPEEERDLQNHAIEIADKVFKLADIVAEGGTRGEIAHNRLISLAEEVGSEDSSLWRLVSEEIDLRLREKKS